MHLESCDLFILHRQCRSRHVFLIGGGVLVSQDDDKTWTLHSPTPLDTDITKFDPLEAISRTLSGSSGTKVPIKVDKVVVTSLWRPNIYLAKEYTSPHKRIILAGDSAHQTVPAGGFGMKIAVGDSFDLGWNGAELLDLYEAERRHIAAQNLDQPRKDWDVHGQWRSMVEEHGDLKR